MVIKLQKMRLTKLPNIRKRIVISLILYISLLSIVVGFSSFLINEKIEKRIFKTVLNIEAAQLVQNQGQEKIPYLLWFDTAKGDHIPKELEYLKIGVHNEISYEGKLYIVRVQGTENNKKIVALDVTDLEHYETEILLSTFILALLAMLLIAFLTYRQLNKLIDPLLKMAERLSILEPENENINFEVTSGSFHESYIISNALNKYIEKSQDFIHREKLFFETASHELRTPISVISGAIEVLQQQSDIPSHLLPHLKRVAQVTDEMEELLAMLLFLARDKDRLNQYAEHLDLSQELPKIIDDHLHLCRGKELTLINDIQQPIYVYAPPQLLRIVIGNLVRNAIEHSDRGKIHLKFHHQQLIIIDPGHGMTAQEISALYTQQAKKGEVRIGGIGIELTLKICQHYGWQLHFESQINRGTKSILTMI